MDQKTIIWIAAFVGALAYFGLKAWKNWKTALAGNIEFDLKKALFGDLFEIIVSLGLVFWYLSTGGTGIKIPGIDVDLSTWTGAFMTGLAISYVGVNYALGIIDTLANQIPGVEVKLADRNRRLITNQINENNPPPNPDANY